MLRVRYRLAQRLERGSVTAFGSTLQAIAKDIAGHATGVAGADIMLQRDGRRYYIQVKSGPHRFRHSSTAVLLAFQQRFFVGFFHTLIGRQPPQYRPPPRLPAPAAVLFIGSTSPL